MFVELAPQEVDIGRLNRGCLAKAEAGESAQRDKRPKRVVGGVEKGPDLLDRRDRHARLGAALSRQAYPSVGSRTKRWSRAAARKTLRRLLKRSGRQRLIGHSLDSLFNVCVPDASELIRAELG
ncbi:MAG: hypothetical protein ABI808_15030 [Pseudonocardiales bacterium]